ncbi:MAG: FecR domain-containing protein [Acidovorax sp.]
MSAHLPAHPGTALPAPVVDAAVEWLVHLWYGTATAESRADWQRWRAAHPQHEQAWQQIEATDTRLRGRTAGMVTAATAVTTLAGPPSPRRRHALRGIGGLAVGGMAAWLGYEQLPWRGWGADLRTARGEQRSTTLPDGTRIVLNTSSALDVRYTAGLRRLHLREGEVLITTAPDGAATPPRPFVVDTPAGRIRALGTRFTVRHDGSMAPVDALRDTTEVAVFEGAVELSPVQSPGAAVRLQAGQSALLSARGITASADAAAAEPPAWAEGVLVASDMRLSDFVAELRRYRSGVISLAPEVAHLRLSGVFPLADTDRILQSLAQVLPVEVRVPVRYWVRIGPSA